MNPTTMFAGLDAALAECAKPLPGRDEMAEQVAPTEGFHSLAALGFDGLEHTLPATSGNGRAFVWLRAVGEEAVHVELPRQFESKVKLFTRFAARRK